LAGDLCFLNEFGGLAEQLGAQLEFQISFACSEQGIGFSERRKNAALAYFTAGRLINTIWIEGLTEEEMLILADETASDVSRYRALQSFIERVTASCPLLPWEYPFRRTGIQQTVGDGRVTEKLAPFHRQTVSLSPPHP